MAEFAEDEATGVHGAKVEHLSVYPNPTVGAVQVVLPESVKGNVDVLVFNANGNLVQRVSSTCSGKVFVDLSDKPAGMYFISVGNARAKVVRN